MKPSLTTTTDDEVQVLETYRELVERGFGDQSISVHRKRLTKNWITLKKDVPSPFREVSRAS